MIVCSANLSQIKEEIKNSYNINDKSGYIAAISALAEQVLNKSNRCNLQGNSLILIQNIYNIAQSFLGHTISITQEATLKIIEENINKVLNPSFSMGSAEEESYPVSQYGRSPRQRQFQQMRSQSYPSMIPEYYF